MLSCLIAVHSVSSCLPVLYFFGHSFAVPHAFDSCGAAEICAQVLFSPVKPTVRTLLRLLVFAVEEIQHILGVGFLVDQVALYARDGIVGIGGLQRQNLAADGIEDVDSLL